MMYDGKLGKRLARPHLFRFALKSLSTQRILVSTSVCSRSMSMIDGLDTIDKD